MIFIVQYVYTWSFLLDTNNGLANVNFPNETTAIVTFKPSPAQQRNFTENGIKGQFIVEYDVDRTANGGEILVSYDC